MPSDDIDLALDAALSIEDDAVRDGAAHAHGDMAHADAADAAAAGADQAVALATELGRYDARVQLLLAFADASVDSLDDRCAASRATTSKTSRARLAHPSRRHLDAGYVGCCSPRVRSSRPSPRRRPHPILTCSQIGTLCGLPCQSFAARCGRSTIGQAQLLLHGRIPR